ncbi:MAG: FecR family protein [Kiritimatiellia bacterium]
MKIADANLIEKYLSGTATAEEFAVLEDRLRSSPATRLELLQEAGFECQLRTLLKRSKVVSQDLVAPPPASRKLYWKPAWLWIPVAAAAAALIAVLAFPVLSARYKDHHPARSLVKKEHLKSMPDYGQPLEGKGVATASQPNNKKLEDRSLPLPEKESGTVVFRPVNPEPQVIVRQGPPAGDRVAAQKPDSLPAHPRTMLAGTPANSVQLPQTVYRKDFNGNAVAAVRPASELSGKAVLNGAATRPVAVSVSSPTDGRVASVAGTAYLTRLSITGGARNQVQAGAVFLPGDVIATGPASGMTLQYVDGSMIRLYSNTQLTMNRIDQGRDLMLSAGAIDLRVKPLGQGTNLVVHTAHVDARVVGTEFRVMTDTSGSWVGVKTGRVELVRTRANGEVVLLDTGYFAASSRGGSPVSISDANWRGKCNAFTGNSKYP